MATKLEGGGGKALVAGPQFFFAASLSVSFDSHYIYSHAGSSSFYREPTQIFQKSVCIFYLYILLDTTWIILTLIIFGGGGKVEPCEVKFSE